MSMKILAAIKKFLTLVIVWLSENTNNDSNKLVTGNETGGVALNNLLD